MQVEQEVFLKARAVQGGQAHDEGIIKILPHPLFQLQAIAAIGRQAVGIGGIVLTAAAAVGKHGNAGNKHQGFWCNFAQVFPGSAHNFHVRFRVSVGQKHGRRHARIDAKVRLCAVLGGNIAAMAHRGKRMFCPQVAPHKARRPHQQIPVHAQFPFYILIQNILYRIRGKKATKAKGRDRSLSLHCTSMATPHNSRLTA